MPAKGEILSYAEERAEHERLVAIGREIVLNAAQLFIDFDIESDGDPGGGSMRSFGAVTPHSATFYREFRPITDKYDPIRHAFCEKHGLERSRLLVEGAEPAQATEELSDWVHDQARAVGKKVVGQGLAIGSDNAFVSYYCTIFNVKNPFGHATLDLKSLAMNFVDNWDWDLTKKTKLPRILLPERDFTHNALDDSFYQQETSFAMVGLIRTRLAELS